MTINVLSYGGGVQSVATVLLIVAGKLPQPDYIVCADTGREVQSTWDYLDGVLRPHIGDRLTIHVAPHSLATVDLYGKNGNMLMPVYTQTGKFSTYCSNEWKARVVARYVAQLSGRPQSEQRYWINFTLDERDRATPDAQRWYPLLDLMLSRVDCVQLIADAGLPIPRKSACYMCPHRHNSEWRHVRDAYPNQWRDAIRLDEELRDADERGGVFLHRSRVPLAQADLDAPDPAQDRQCGLGMCFL